MDISKRVIRESLKELSLVSEGESLWDYRLDSIYFEIIESRRPELDEYLGKVIKIYYANLLIYQGVVNGANYDFKSRRTQIESDSIGMFAAKLAPYDTVYSGSFEFRSSSGANRTGGETLTEVVNRLRDAANNNLSNEGYNFTLPLPDVDTADFEDYLSLKYYNMTSQIDFVRIYTIKGREYVGKLAGIWQAQNGNAYYIYMSLGAANVWCVLMDETGNMANGAQEYRGYIVNNWITVYNANDSIRDTCSIGKYLESGEGLRAWELFRYQVSEYNLVTHSVLLNSGASERIIVLSYDRDGVTRYIHRGRYVQFDGYYYLYEGDGKNIGNILREFAVVSDMIIWIDPNGVIHTKSRSSTATIEIPQKNILERREEIVPESGKLEISDNIFIDEFVRRQIESHYRLYLQGNKLVTELEVVPWEGMPASADLMLQKVSVLQANLGIVKKIIYGETRVKLTMERRI